MLRSSPPAFAILVSLLVVSACVSSPEVAAPTTRELVAQAEAARAHDRWEEATRLYGEALARFGGPEDVEQRTAVLAELGTLKRVLGRFTESEQHLREALATVTERFGRENPVAGTLLIELAMILEFQQKLDEAESEAREGLAILERVRGPTDEATIRAVSVLANVSVMAERYTQGAPLFEREIAYYRSTGKFLDYIPELECNLGVSLLRQEKSAEAFPHLSAGYAARSKKTDSVPPQWVAYQRAVRAATLAFCAYHYGLALKLRGEERAAIDPLREAHAFYETAGPRFEKTLAAVQAELAGSLTMAAWEGTTRTFDKEMLTEAVDLARKSLASRSRLLDSEDEQIAGSTQVLGAALLAQGELTEAESTLLRSANIYRKLATPEAYRVTQNNAIIVLINLASLFQAQQRWSVARVTLLEAVEILKLQRNPDQQLSERAQDLLALSLVSGG